VTGRPVDCGRCGRRLAVVSPVLVRVPIPGEGAVSDIPIGDRVELEPGFVNSTGRQPHPSGIRRHFVRGPNPSRASGTTKLPVVLTCGCGEEAVLVREDSSGIAASRAIGAMRAILRLENPE
jgi:hypothetical protein